jgi:hypothetical protein
MDLGGDLAVMDPSMIFQVTGICGLTGKMKLITVDNVASFWFREGGLLFATIDTRRRKIGEFLIENGMITDRQLDEALKEMRKAGGKKRIGDILIERGDLEHEALEKAIHEQIKDVVYEVLPWKKGQFVFFHDVEPENEDILLDIRMDHLILEGLKRIDEAARD